MRHLSGRLPAAERDACGIGFVTTVSGETRRDVVELALEALGNVKHRGALAADFRTGDGAGLLTTLPDAFLGAPGVAVCFLPPEAPEPARELIEAAAAHVGLAVTGWRPVPVCPDALGDRGRATMPRIEHALLDATGDDAAEQDRRAYRLRQVARGRARADGVGLYIASCSFRTIVYKALCAADQLRAFYPDLTNPGFAAGIAVFHQRFSTNTSPSWERAQPFSVLAHNGEINTIAGNVAAMVGRADVGAEAAGLGPDAELQPICDPDGSDSGQLDDAVALLHAGGRDLRVAFSMLIPEAWENVADIDPDVRDFYRYHASLLEPWDGPAGIVATDGVRAIACLDRNGLRPLRYAVCEDGLVVCASEAGVLPLDGRGTVKRGRLGPGQMLCVGPNGAPGRVQAGADIDAFLAATAPYGSWLARHLLPVDSGRPAEAPDPELELRQVLYGWTREDVANVLKPMATDGKEPTFSMGDDTAPAVLASFRRPVFNYLKQRFAQVTNPAIDHLRERLVMSLRTLVGRRARLLSMPPDACRHVELDTFLLTPDGLASLADVRDPRDRTARFLAPVWFDATFPVDAGPEALPTALDVLATRAAEAVRTGATLLIVSDRAVSPARAPIPILLACGAVHHALLGAGLRPSAAIAADTDEARDVHHMACLLGVGVDVISPALALHVVAALADTDDLGETSAAEAQDRYRGAIEDGVLKVMSKMGISIVSAYRGAQIFEAIGLGGDVVDTCFAGMPSQVGGLGLAAFGEDALARHAAAYGGGELPNPGFVRFLKRGSEYHANNPDVVEALQAAADAGGRPAAADVFAAHTLQRALADGAYELYERFSALVTDRPALAIRDLLELVPAGPPVPLDEVESADEIVTRFSSGGMSHGSLSAEAHETLSIAMNLLGAKSNCGEGGEDPQRYLSRGTHRDRNSRIKQVASGRFGVTPAYCVYADELQIKIAQGSKPGEGGQLPGHKVSVEIARLRHTQPGVTLISPPPHHDIYSIEDLAQLVFDLKQVNPNVLVSVKLVVEAGVGTVAAGCVKALADVVHIAGADGGTGASPLSSIKHAGLPWELGLAESRRVLRTEDLRSRVRLRVDGGMRTGRDALVAFLLGADEVSFGTAVMVAEGCIMVRACHRDTCPTGIATQRPNLRAKFTGTPEKVAAYLVFVAEEARRLLAGLGLRSVEEAIGRVDLLRQRRTGDPRADALDLGSLLADDGAGPRAFNAAVPLQRPVSQFDAEILEASFLALIEGVDVTIEREITNRDRTVGARLGGTIALEHGGGLPRGTITLELTGTAGQSFGAFCSPGMTMRLAGDANDGVGKAMAGGRIAIRPPANDAGNPVLVGNAALYGATAGALFVAGRAGERFGVRNSGADAVVEGVGLHACEYMTGGTVVILGSFGHNLGAGMTGGECFVLDADARLGMRLNGQLVHAVRADHAAMQRLQALIEEHVTLTGSMRAAALLAEWDEAVERFWRIVPLGATDRHERVAAAALAGSR